MGGQTYAEAAVREVLTAADAEVDAAIGYAALLLACAGATSESDRLVRRWHACTGRPVTTFTADPLTARAWAMLLEARGALPDWAGELDPLDLDAEEEAHRDHLAKDAGELRTAAAEAQARAAEGDADGATSALARWAELARDDVKPDVATLAACRHVAPLLVRGVLTVPRDWARDYAGTLIAALHQRYQPAAEHRHWPGLIGEILRLRGEPDSAPPPASAAGIAAAERRLGLTLPDDYREFLLTCDGLPADVVFPRLLGVSELTADADGVTISEPGTVVLRPATGEVLDWDPLFGETTHPGIRSLLEEHLRLLEASSG
ncbi:SMI1/KNR4 family protein [Prauserella muralis]|uniref:Glucan biosynthesis protein n=1 Tax=Prauserella muralis TaxID=588067 RepID=A0A2V4AZA5_9PSEU|nr:SMI1/KNR4 family protein [Prauserella muralis]PXY27236.1 glucan biosynthesis protein [Prauserella muralis]TWE23108.1 SMI1/KNR4 family protein SUKH-1 [Prauserella muralis]